MKVFWRIIAFLLLGIGLIETISYIVGVNERSAIPSIVAVIIAGILPILGGVLILRKKSLRANPEAKASGFMKKRFVIPLTIAVWLVLILIIGAAFQKSNPGKQQPQQTAQDNSQEVSESAEQPLTAVPTSQLQPVPVESEEQNSVPTKKPKGVLEPIDPEETEYATKKVAYEIAAIEPAHFYYGPSKREVKRFAYRVVIYQRLNKVQLEKIADEIFKKAKKETPFNAIKVSFTDYPQFLGRLGTVDYAPNGDWASAAVIETGKYSTIKKNSHLFEPDWTDALTEREAEIYAYYTVVEHKYVESTEGTDMDLSPLEKAQAEIANKYGMTEDEVFQLLMKYSRGYEKKP